jgi:hypothetical protein
MKAPAHALNQITLQQIYLLLLSGTTVFATLGLRWIMDASQCANKRPPFGLLAVTQKLRAYIIMRVLTL